MDFELVKYSIKAYLKRKDKDLTKLSIYANKLGVSKEVANYIKIFYEQYGIKGTISLYHMDKLVDEIEAFNIGCEYGEYCQCLLQLLIIYSKILL